MLSWALRINRSKALWWLFLAFVFSIPLPQSVSIKLLILALLFSFTISNSLTNFRKLLARTWDILFYLLLLCIGLIYSEDLDTGFKEIETSLSLIALPFVLLKIPNLSKEQLHKIFFTFAAGLLVACLIYLAHASVLYFRSEDSTAFFSGKLTEVIINSHPTYLAYYLILVITFGINLMYYEESGISPFVIILILLFLFLMLMLTAGRTAFISVLLIFSFFVLKFITETDKSGIRKLTFGVVIFLLIGLFVANLADTSKASGENGDYWERLVLWESAIKATPDIIWGVGTGDYKKVLNDYYLSHNLSKFADESYNSHNQFIQILFSNGSIGVLSLLLLMGRPLYLSVRNQNVLGMLSFCSFFIYGMTEVFLGRYQGVVFFALLHQTFITYYQYHKPSFSLKDS